MKRTNAREAKARWRGKFQFKNPSFCVALLIAAAVPFMPDSALAQSKSRAAAPTASEFRLKDPSVNLGTELFITVNRKERMIAREARKAWIVSGGRKVVYSTADGAGGFENEGESLRIYDVATRRTMKIMSEYEVVDALTETKLASGKTVFLVKMSDGGAGISSFVLIDPARGQVFKRDFAELIKIDGDVITLAYYNRRDWDAINEERGWSADGDINVVLTRSPKVAPERTERFDLRKVVVGKVIYNKRTNRF